MRMLKTIGFNLLNIFARSDIPTKMKNEKKIKHQIV